MITIKNKKQIETIQEGGKILAEVLDKVKKMVSPGINTADLEKVACELIRRAGGRPAFKGYKQGEGQRPFPTTLCTSINDEIVHAPSLPARTLNEGDIIGIDVGMEWPYGKNESGCYTDMAYTLGVGQISEQAKNLLQTTKKSLKLAIKAAQPGNTLNDIGKAVQQCVEKNGFSVVRDLVGHGVGLDVHEEPQVPHYEIKNREFENYTLQPGMVIAIEPMVNVGDWNIKCLDDGFTFATLDGSLSAQFEHTIIITEKGNIVATKLR